MATRNELQLRHRAALAEAVLQAKWGDEDAAAGLGNGDSDELRALKASRAIAQRRADLDLNELRAEVARERLEGDVARRQLALLTCAPLARAAPNAELAVRGCLSATRDGFAHLVQSLPSTDQVARQATAMTMQR